MTRRFYIRRDVDETGVSGTGRVLEGVLLDSGRVVVEWRAPMRSMGIYENLEQFLQIHVRAHPSKSEIVWEDELEVFRVTHEEGCAIVDGLNTLLEGYPEKHAREDGEQYEVERLTELAIRFAAQLGVD